MLKQFFSKLFRSNNRHIHRSMPYVPIGRKLLKVASYGDGTVTKDLASVAHVIPRRGGVPDRFTEGEEFKVPSFAIGSNPTFNKLIPEIKSITKQAIQKAEDTEILCAIEAAAPRSHVVYVSPDSTDLEVSAGIDTAMACLEEHDVIVRNIVLHPKDKYRFLNAINFDDFIPSSEKEFIKTRCIGEYRGAKVYSCYRNTPTSILFMAEPSHIGVVLVKEDYTFRMNSKNLKNVHRVYDAVGMEEIGICVVNDWAISKVRFENEPVEELPKIAEESVLMKPVIKKKKVK